MKSAEFGPSGVHRNHPGAFQRALTNIEIWPVWGRVTMTLTVRRLNYQLPPTEEKMKPPVHIWIERLRAKYDRSRLKNEREHPVVRLGSSHYIGEIVKVGYWL